MTLLVGLMGRVDGRVTGRVVDTVANKGPVRSGGRPVGREGGTSAIFVVGSVDRAAFKVVDKVAVRVMNMLVCRAAGRL